MSVEHYENFPVASLLCPAELREAVLAIYRFARTADDLADEGGLSAQERLTLLADYRADLLRVVGGAAPGPRWQPVFAPLAVQMLRHGLPAPLLLALLDAFTQDARNPWYEDRASLLDYCARSANPVGRLLLHLYRVGDAQSLRQSDAICSALQLINFWQDLSVDLPRARLYLPLADLRRFGLTPEQVLDASGHGRIAAPARALVRELCAWAATTMSEGAPLALRLPGRAGWELRLVVQGGLRILEKIGAMDHDSLRRRPVLQRADAPRLLWRGLRMRA